MWRFFDIKMFLVYEAQIKGPIEYKNRIYNLNKNFFVIIEANENGVKIKDSISCISSYGKSLPKAIKNFSKKFDFYYRKLVINKDCSNNKDIVVGSILKDLVSNLKTKE